MHKYAFFMHVARTQASQLHSNTLPPTCHIQIDYSSLNRLILRIFVQNRVFGQMLRVKGSHTKKANGISYFGTSGSENCQLF